MKLKFILASLLTLGLMGCAFSDGEGRSTVEGRIAEDLRQARQEIAPIIGYWTGTLNRGGTVLDIEVSIQEDLNPTGRTADGQTIYRVDPRASLSSLDGRYNQTFTGTYIKGTGELILTTSQNPGDFDQIQSLSLIHRGSTLTGSARTPAGYLGEVTLTLQGRQNSGNQRDNEEVRAERLRQIFSTLVGTWEGRVTPPTQSTYKPFDVAISIYLDEEPTSTGRSFPVLRATYEVTSGGDPSILRRSLKLTYAYANNPPTLVFNSTNPTGYSLSISGRFAEREDGSLNMNRIVGTHTNTTLGLTSRVELQRKGASGDSKQTLPGSKDIPVPTPRPQR